MLISYQEHLTQTFLVEIVIYSQVHQELLPLVH
jgi:hypothetical protein